MLLERLGLLEAGRLGLLEAGRLGLLEAGRAGFTGGWKSWVCWRLEGLHTNCFFLKMHRMNDRGSVSLEIYPLFWRVAIPGDGMH